MFSCSLPLLAMIHLGQHELSILATTHKKFINKLCSALVVVDFLASRDAVTLFIRGAGVAAARSPSNQQTDTVHSVEAP